MRSATAAIRAFAGAAALAQERCEFCGAALGQRHAHVHDTAAGVPRCACAACAALFPPTGPGRYRRNARPVERVAGPVCGEAEWQALGVPVGLAWFYRDAGGRLQARYPGAAGPVAAPADERWQDVAGGIAAFRALEPGIEALLVRRHAARAECWRVPMERCWELAGLLRRHWRGLDGGDELRAQLDRFFHRLDHDAS